MSLRIDNIYIPDKEAKCQSWKLYFDALNKRFGKEKARELWLYTFNQRGNTSCAKDQDFNNWADKNQIAVANGLDKALAGAGKVGHNLIGGAASLSKLVPKLWALLLIGGVATVLFILFRLSKETKVDQIAEFIPAGKALKAAKLLKQ